MANPEHLKLHERPTIKLYRRIENGILLRSEGIVIFANPSALKLFRANHPGSLIGKQYLDLVHPVENLEAEFSGKNGRTRIGLMSSCVLRLNQEEVILSITRRIFRFSSSFKAVIAWSLSRLVAFLRWNLFTYRNV
jgi:PAS domain-containing protein